MNRAFTVFNVIIKDVHKHFTSKVKFILTAITQDFILLQNNFTQKIRI